MMSAAPPIPKVMLVLAGVLVGASVLFTLGALLAEGLILYGSLLKSPSPDSLMVSTLFGLALGCVVYTPCLVLAASLGYGAVAMGRRLASRSRLFSLGWVGVALSVLATTAFFLVGLFAIVFLSVGEWLHRL